MSRQVRLGGVIRHEASTVGKVVGPQEGEMILTSLATFAAPSHQASCRPLGQFCHCQGVTLNTIKV